MRIKPGLSLARGFQKIFLRSVALATLKCFIVTSITLGISPEAIAASWSGSPSFASSLPFPGIPKEMGKLDGIFTPTAGNRSVFFLHIKDAHASMEAQRNINRILARLQQRKQLDLVFVEGAAGPLTPERLDVFDETQKNAAYKKDLFDAGLLNGAAYFVAAQKSGLAYGLEDPAAYFENLQIFKYVVSARSGTEKFFNTVEVLMMNTFKNILRVDVFAFLKEWKMQHQKEIAWGRYLPFLVQSAEKFLGLNLQDYRAQAAWPNLVRFRHLDFLQEKIHGEAVQKEFRTVSRALEHDRDPKLRQAMTLLSTTLESPAAIIRETSDFRQYVEILVAACRRAGVLLQQYPALVRYLAFRTFRSEIEPEGLLAEVERLEDAIFDKIFSKGKMRGIIAAYRDFFLLKRAFALELSRAESNRFLAMDIEKKVHQFSKVAPERDLLLEDVIRGAERVKQFYKAAQKRDIVFAEQVQNSLKTTKVFSDRPFFIALVTGGYHAEGIENWFRKEGLPFASIQPSFKDEPDANRYEKYLVGDYRTADALSTPQGSVHPDATAEKLMGPSALRALRDAEARVMARFGMARPPLAAAAKPAPKGERDTARKEVRLAAWLTGRSEIRSKGSGAILNARQRSLMFLAAMVVAGLFSGCASLSHTELKKTLREAEEYELPRRSIAALPVTHIDSESLLQRILENDPKVKKARIEIAISEIEKDRLKGAWSITTRAAWDDGKLVFSGGLGATIPHVVEGGVAGYGAGSLAMLAVDLAASLSSIFRGEPMLARALAEKMVQAAQLNHQKIIGERYAYYAGIAIEIRKFQKLYETSQQAMQDLEAALKVSEERNEATEFERTKIRNLLDDWRGQADRYRASLGEKEALLLNLYTPGTIATTQFKINLTVNELSPGWSFDPTTIQSLRDDATRKKGSQLPPNRGLAAAYKGREAAVVVSELERARGRFGLGFGGFSFMDNLGSPSGMSASEKEAVGSARDRELDRRTKDKSTAGISGQISFGEGAKADERIASRNVEITDAVLEDVQRTVENEISGAVHRIGKHQDEIRTRTAQLQRLEGEIQRARQIMMAGRRFVTEDQLAGSVAEAWDRRIELIEAGAGIEQAILTLETTAGVMGSFSWRKAGDGRSELRESFSSGQNSRSPRFFRRSLLFKALIAIFLALGFLLPSSALAGRLDPALHAVRAIHAGAAGFGTTASSSVIAGYQKADKNSFAAFVSETVRKVPNASDRLYLAGYAQGLQNVLDTTTPEGFEKARSYFAERADMFMPVSRWSDEAWLKKVNRQLDRMLRQVPSSDRGHVIEQIGDASVGDQIPAMLTKTKFRRHPKSAFPNSRKVTISGSVRVTEELKKTAKIKGMLEERIGGEEPSRGETSGQSFQKISPGELAPAGTAAMPSFEPAVESFPSALVKPQVSPLGPGLADSTQLPAPVLEDQPADASPVMQILRSHSAGVPDVSHPDAGTNVPDPASDDRFDASVAPQAAQENNTAPAGTGSTGNDQPLSPQPAEVAVPGGDAPAQGLQTGPAVIAQSPANVPDPSIGASAQQVFSGQTEIHPVFSDISAPFSGIPEFSVNEGDTVPEGSVYGRIIDPENAGHIRALEQEIALIDARAAASSLSAADYMQLQFQRESLDRERRERTYREELGVLKASHPMKVVKLTRGQVKQGNVLVHGVRLDGGQLVLSQRMGQVDCDSADLLVNSEPVRILHYGPGDPDPVSGQFHLTVDFVSPSGTELGSRCHYKLSLGRRHAQGPDDDTPLGPRKPYTVMTPEQREPVPVTAPVAPGIPGGPFQALVPEGSVVSAGMPVGMMDASRYQQGEINAAETLRRLVAEATAANQQFSVISPEQLRKLNEEVNLRIASLGLDPKIVVRAPVSGRIRGLMAVGGQVLTPGQPTGIFVESSLVTLGTVDPTDSDHLIDVPKGSVREGEKVRVRTPLGDVLDGTVFKVLPLADENGLWLSDRDTILVQVEDGQGGRLGDAMPVQVWTDPYAQAPGGTGALGSQRAMLPARYQKGDLSPGAFYRLLRHPDQELSRHSVLAGEGSLRQILSSWKFFFKSPMGLAAMGKWVVFRAFAVLGGGIVLWLIGKFIRVAAQKIRWAKSKARLRDLVTITGELQYRLLIRFDQQGRQQDKELLDSVIGPINEWARMLKEEGELDHEKRTTILIKAQELASNKHLLFSGIKFWDINMWNTQIGTDLRIVYGILTVLCILTARRITEQARNTRAAVELHEYQVFQQRLVDYGDIFNESYNLAHHLGAMAAVLDHYADKLIPGLGPERRALSFRSLRMIVHNRVVRFFFPFVRLFYWISPVALIHRIITLRSFRSLNGKMARLGLKNSMDAQEDIKNAKKAIAAAFNGQVTLDSAVGLGEKNARFWRRALAMIAISALFLPMGILIYMGVHWLSATLLMMMGFGTLMIPLAAIAFQIGPTLIRFIGPYHRVWQRELENLKQKNRRLEHSLPEIPKPRTPRPDPALREMTQRGSEQIAMSKVLNALHDTALIADLDVVALVPRQDGENKSTLERLIAKDAVLRAWPITVMESDGEFPGDAGLFFAAKRIAQKSPKNFKIYWYPQPGIDFRTALAVFKINLGEAARMIGNLRAAGVRFGEVAFPGGNIASSSVDITKNGGHFVVQTRYASLNEIKEEQHPAVLGRNGTTRLEIEHVVSNPDRLREMLSDRGALHLGSGRLDMANAALPQIPVPTGPVAIVAETPEENQTIQDLLQSARDRIRTLTDRITPFRVSLFYNIVRPIVDLSRQIEKNSVNPPNPNSLVERTVRLPDDKVVNPYGKYYAILGRFLWNGGNESRRSFKAEAFIPPVSETFYVAGKKREGLAQALDRVAANFPGLVDPEISRKLREEEPAGTKAKFVFLDHAGERVLEWKREGYMHGFRSEDVAGFVIKDGKIALQRRDYQSGNEPGHLDVSFAGHQEESDGVPEAPAAAAKREFHEELLGGRRPVPEGVFFRPVGPPIQLEITHESEQGLSIRKKNSTVYRVSLNSEFSWDDFLPGDNAAEIFWMTRGELEAALRETPGRFTARAYQLLTKLDLDMVFSEVALGFPTPSGKEGTEIRAPRSEIRINLPPAVMPVPGPASMTRGNPEIPLIEDEEIPQFQASEELRIWAAILIYKILAAKDADLLLKLNASLEDLGMVSDRVVPALAALANAHDVPIENLKIELESLLRQEQTQTFADERIVFLDAGTVPAEYFKKLMSSPLPVVVLFDRRHQALYEKVSKEQLRGQEGDHVILVYAPDGVSAFVKRALQSGDKLLTVSPRLNDLLARFRRQGKAGDIALITKGRTESQKVESYYVGNRYYYSDEILQLDPELIYYSLELILRSPELFRHRGRKNAQNVVSLIGLVLQQLAISMRGEQAVKIAA